MRSQGSDFKGCTMLHCYTPLATCATVPHRDSTHTISIIYLPQHALLKTKKKHQYDKNQRKSVGLNS